MYGLTGKRNCIFVLHTLIQKILARKSKLYCAFIDYEKAFDTIIHDAMWKIDVLIQQNVFKL